MKQFDYIFAGTGLAALMTVYKMIQSGKFKDKSILLLDENSKKTNDRTWCFWQEKETIWEQISNKKWDFALFANEEVRLDLDLKPYSYNQIKAIDFYNLVFDLISTQENVSFLNEQVTAINELKTHVYVATQTQSFTAGSVFNSIYNKNELQNQTEFPVLQQHFVGWFIKSEEAVFNPEKATFMDFSVAQKGNTRFMYVLPTSKNEALVEYTLFSHQLLEKNEYESEIENYIQKLGTKTYQILEKEQGSIPMTCFPFWKKNTRRLLNVGTAGGWTKASTGYTFKFSDKKTTDLVDFIQTETDFRKFHKTNRFWFYDLLLLTILDKKNQMGSRIFTSLFTKGSPALIFKFLDEEITFYEDLKVILKCPKMPFILALIHLLNKKMQVLFKIKIDTYKTL